MIDSGDKRNNLSGKDYQSVWGSKNVGGHGQKLRREGMNSEIDSRFVVVKGAHSEKT